MREAIDKLERAEDALPRREARACASVSALLFCASRTRGGKKKIMREKKSHGKEKRLASSSGTSSGDVSPGTSSSSCDSVEADAELAMATGMTVCIAVYTTQEGVGRQASQTSAGSFFGLALRNTLSLGLPVAS